MLDVADYDDGRRVFVGKLDGLRREIIAELAYAGAEYELATCLPSLEGGWDALELLRKMNATSSGAQLAGRLELLRLRLAAVELGLEVMRAEA